MFGTEVRHLEHSQDEEVVKPRLQTSVWKQVSHLINRETSHQVCGDLAFRYLSSLSPHFSSIKPKNVLQINSVDASYTDLIPLELQKKKNH